MNRLFGETPRLAGRVGSFNKICGWVCLIAMGMVVWAKSLFALPPVSITSCQTITKSGFYEIDSPLTAPGAGDCLVVKAANAVLNLNGWAITGKGGGVGVHVMSTAANAFIEGRGTTISGFMEGIQIEANDTFAGNFTVSNNGDAGVFLRNTKQARVSDFTASGNLEDGVRVLSGIGNVMHGFSAFQNGRYGVWLKSTKRNAIGSFEVKNNALAGLYLGCSDSGPSVKCKKSAPAATFNAVFDGTAIRGSDGNQDFGVAIDLGDDSNRVSSVTSSFNAQLDIVDKNPDCSNNIWMAVVFGTSNQSGCIP